MQSLKVREKKDPRNCEHYRQVMRGVDTAVCIDCTASLRIEVKKGITRTFIEAAPVQRDAPPPPVVIAKPKEGPAPTRPAITKPARIEPPPTLIPERVRQGYTLEQYGSAATHADIAPQSIPVKRGPGRPKGSKNKPKVIEREREPMKVQAQSRSVKSEPEPPARKKKVREERKPLEVKKKKEKKNSKVKTSRPRYHRYEEPTVADGVAEEDW